MIMVEAEAVTNQQNSNIFKGGLRAVVSCKCLLSIGGINRGLVSS